MSAVRIFIYRSLFVLAICLGIVQQAIYAQTTLFFDNCNTLTNWTNTGAIFPTGGAGYNWQSVVPFVPATDHTGGGNVLYVNGNGFYMEANAGNYILYQITSQNINLSGFNQTRLEFWMQMRAETGGWDGGFVEVSSNGGASWTQLSNTQLCVPYDGNMSQNPSSTPFYPGTKPAWFNFRTSWTRVVADISAFDNTPNFRIRYTFHSDEALNDYGWALDDIRIVSIARPEVRGNSVVIAHNDLVPQVLDFTDFGSVPVGQFIDRTFFIHNVGESPLTLTGTPYIQLTGAGFSVVAQPTVPTIPAGGSVPFTVRYAPTAGGPATAQISIPNSDDFSACTPPNPYRFAVTGRTINTAPYAIGLHDTVICPGTVLQIPFTIVDNEQNPASILLAASSSDASLVSPGGLIFSGTGANRILTVNPMPGASGTVQITVVLNDMQPVNNDSTFTFNVQLDDFVAPVVQCQNLTVQLDAIGNASISPTQADNGTTDNCASVNLQLSRTSFTCSDVGIQSVWLIATDNSGNTDSCQFWVTVQTTPIQLSYTSPQYNGFSIRCNGSANGSISTSITGGCPPYQIAWSHDPVFTGSNATNLPAGLYTVTVTDAAGQTQTLTVSLTEPPALTDQSTATDVSCAGAGDGNLQLNALGGVPPYIYSIGPSLQALPPGIFSYTITDQQSCSITGQQVINEPPAMSLEGQTSYALFCGDSVIVRPAIIGGSAPFSYQWAGDIGLNCFDCAEIRFVPTGSGYITAFVTDSRGCTATLPILIDVSCELFIPNAFTPNGNALNDVFRAHAEGIQTFEMRIYNRWGQELYRSIDVLQGWDGRYDGEPLPQGIYVYDIRALLPNGLEIKRRGHFTLIR